MSLVVETGSGLADAESYASVADADLYISKYATAVQKAAWTALDTTTKEDRLRIGTQYLELVYANLYTYSRTSLYQRLSWPQAWVEDRQGFAIGADVVPESIVQATVEAALRADTDIMPDVVSANIMSETVIVGPIEKSVRYAGDQGSSGAGKPTIPKFRKIDLLMSQWINANGGLERS